MTRPSVLVPDAGRWIDAIRSALSLDRGQQDRLCFNGRELQWMEKPRPGWFRIAVPLRVYQQAEEASVCAG